MTMTQDEIRQHVRLITQNPDILTADDDPLPELKVDENPPARHVGGVGDRPVVLLRELWEGETWDHGVFLGPVGLSGDEALKIVDAVFKAVVAADREEWNYDDVHDALKTDGFIQIEAAEWWEPGA